MMPIRVKAVAMMTKHWKSREKKVENIVIMLIVIILIVIMLIVIMLIIAMLIVVWSSI